ncbi:MAG: ABC transporter six-transmembrane domain-containing protein, partial [Stenotrophomonas maltophilia]|nr:ABC transporter six-transmembrane domain-containing protein [Stenotrophomonas maltophilia]
ENTLLLAYPLFAGFAVDAIISGNIGHAVSYAGVVLLFWLVGAARRAVDTRTFTRIYADLAVSVVQAQRRLGQATSTSAARVVLAREFVDFFEKHVPIIATALASMFGAVAMLLAIEPMVGAAGLVTLLGALLVLPSFARRNEQLHGRLNNRLEHEIRLVDRVSPSVLRRHYTTLSRLRILLSDREAGAYVVIGLAAAALFALTIGRLATTDGVTPGHAYAVMIYLLTFVGSLDDAPSMVDQLARLKDIGRRVSPGMEDAERKDAA